MSEPCAPLPAAAKTEVISWKAVEASAAAARASAGTITQSNEPAPPVRDLPPLEIKPEEVEYRPTVFVGIGGFAAKVLQSLHQQLADRFKDLTFGARLAIAPVRHRREDAGGRHRGEQSVVARQRFGGSSAVAAAGRLPSRLEQADAMAEPPMDLQHPSLAANAGSAPLGTPGAGGPLRARPRARGTGDQGRRGHGRAGGFGPGDGLALPCGAAADLRHCVEFGRDRQRHGARHGLPGPQGARGSRPVAGGNLRHPGPFAAATTPRAAIWRSPIPTRCWRSCATTAIGNWAIRAIPTAACPPSPPRTRPFLMPT